MDPMTAYVYVVAHEGNALAHSARPHARVVPDKGPRSKPDVARQAVSTALLRASQAIAPA